MSKYPNEQTVGAVYDDAPVGNPFLAAMPDMFPPEKVFEKIGSKLPIPHNLSDMTAEERRRQIPVLSTVFCVEHRVCKERVQWPLWCIQRKRRRRQHQWGRQADR